MIRKLLMMFFIVIPMVSAQQHTFAAEKPNVNVTIASPSQVKDYPGLETNIIAKVTNHTNKPIKDLMVYITMADWGKHWTVNLEDYGADKPVQVGELKPGMTKAITLPIRFVYTSHYYLYATVASTQSRDIYSSTAIPVEIMGNTKIDPLIVQFVSIGVPTLLLLFIGIKIFIKRRLD